MEPLRALLIQPPFLQFNAPYPAIAYLSSFLASIGVERHPIDLSIETTRSIFSREGLGRIFRDAAEILTPERLASERETERSQLLRYLSNAKAYVETIDRVVEYLSGEVSAFEQLCLNPERLPWGLRVERLLSESEGAPDALMLASLIVEDLADFISYAVDGNYALARYAESIASSQRHFSAIRAALDDSYVIRSFVRPLARDALEPFAKAGGRVLACASVPFPGTLLPALAILEEAKALGMETAMGGGYVSTELRWISSRDFFKTVDYLCFDSGFSALESVIRSGSDRAPLFRTMRLSGSGDRVSVEGFALSSAADYADESRWDFRPREDEAALLGIEADRVSAIAPDYGYAPSSRYLRVRDSDNPMLSLWSSEKWLKCRLAYGCYWARCSFCDCSLDYIRSYRPARVKDLHAAMRAQAEASGFRGIHLVDEAAPVPLLIEFGLENARAGRPLAFWGNGRFEPAFTPDRAEFLSWAGMVALSAGIESASPRGLEIANKGLSLADIAASCAALAGAGVLVHAYMIHGLPGEDEQGLIDSLDALRQMFAEGIVHSAFYHRFVLTRHAPFARDAKLPARDGDFAFNDVPSGQPSSRNDAIGAGADAALKAYMAGEGLDRPAQSWFDASLPRTRNARNMIRNLMARGPDRAPPRASRAVFLGGDLLYDDGLAVWSYKNESHGIEIDTKGFKLLREVLSGARPGQPEPMAKVDAVAALGRIAGERGIGSAMETLRRGGLLFI